MFDALGYKSWLETLDAQNYLVQKYTLNPMQVQDQITAQQCLARQKSGDFLSPTRYNGYRSTVGYIYYRGKEPWDNVTRGQAESMCRLTHVIPSSPIKDHIVVGPWSF